MPLRLIPCLVKHSWTEWSVEGWHYYASKKYHQVEHVESRECKRCQKVQVRTIFDE